MWINSSLWTGRNEVSSPNIILGRGRQLAAIRAPKLVRSCYREKGRRPREGSGRHEGCRHERVSDVGRVSDGGKRQRNSQSLREEEERIGSVRQNVFLRRHQ